MIQRIKSAKSLINQKTKRIQKYNSKLLDIVKEIRVYLLEESETDPERPNSK